MDYYRDIALIGLNTLSQMAVNSILKDMVSAEAIIFDSPSATLECRDRDWRYIVSAEVLARNYDFFANRRNKTLVISADRIVQGCDSSAAGSDSVRCVSAFQPREHIVQALKELLEDGDSKGDGRAVLSHREIEVLREVASGKTNKEIADALCISVNTVISHRKNISSKLGIRSASALSLYAVMNGLI